MRSQSTTPKRFGVKYVAIAIAISLIYFAAAKFGFLLAFATRQVTAIWPPTGIAFVAYVIFGYRAWPGVFAGAFLANALSSEPLATAAGIALGNTLPGLIAVFLLGKLGGFERSLERFRDVLGLSMIAAAVSCTVSATNGVANLALGGIIPWRAFGSVWWVWWVGDALGVLLVSPLLLTWFAKPRLGWTGWRLIEFTALFVSLAAVCQIAFSGQIVKTTALFRFEYAVFPFIIWAALRFGQREAASAAVLISAVAIWGAIHDRGPFATGTLDERLILLDVFIAITAVTALTLGAITTERLEAEHNLQQAHDKLEVRVRERTAELAEANKELAKKNEEVEAFVYIVSHDLRAPLVNLQGFSRELEFSCRDLRQSPEFAALPSSNGANRIHAILNRDIPDSLHYITASITKFQRLIDALLTLSRYGRQEYRSEEVDVRGVVEATLDSVRQSIESSGAYIVVGPIPKAKGDATALGQVVSNLVGNALKYLQPGRQGHIEIGGETETENMHLWIRDNGSGIPASAQGRLFQVFQRFHPELAPGDGMGLAIVKRVVDRHGGKVWAESEEGVGTTFHVLLPSADTRN